MLQSTPRTARSLRCRSNRQAILQSLQGVDEPLPPPLRLLAGKQLGKEICRIAQLLHCDTHLVPLAGIEFVNALAALANFRKAAVQLLWFLSNWLPPLAGEAEPLAILLTGCGLILCIEWPPFDRQIEVL